MSDIYKTFVMEIRPRLQSCNVYLMFKQNVDLQLTVDLKENEINIVTGNKTDIITISDYKILIDSLSCLQISNNYLSFRFQTETMNKSVGQFKSEFMMYNFNRTDIKIGSKEIKIVKDILYVIKCTNCQAHLTDSVSFKRILPLPSENAEPAEWFCHKHDDSTISLTPNQQDCFYTECYIHLNRNILTNYRLASNSIIVCKRCLSWLGLALKSDTIQVWFNTVYLESSDSIICSTPSIDFINCVKRSLNDSLLVSSKILFECCNQNNNYEYLCVWVLEKNLQLMIKGHTFQHFSNETNSDTQNVAKVLFRFEYQTSDLVAEWLNDVKVSHIKISKPMMINALNHLYDMCQLIPDCFRISNGFFVSYLIL